MVVRVRLITLRLIDLRVCFGEDNFEEEIRGGIILIPHFFALRSSAIVLVVYYYRRRKSYAAVHVLIIVWTECVSL